MCKTNQNQLSIISHKPVDLAREKSKLKSNLLVFHTDAVVYIFVQHVIKYYLVITRSMNICSRLRICNNKYKIIYKLYEILMFTTLLYLLYPPLKGFSQDQAHTYTYGLCSFLQHLQGDLKQNAFDLVTSGLFAYKIVDLKGILTKG